LKRINVAASILRISAGLAATMLGGCAMNPPPRQAVPLFDGRSLTGWHPELIADNGSDTPLDHVFRVQDGVVHAYAGAPDGSAQPHAILVSDDAYADYRLHVEYRWGTAIFAARKGQHRDAGILLFVRPDEEALVKTWHHWPESLEYQIMEGDTGSAYMLKTRASGWMDPATRRYRSAADGGTAVSVRLTRTEAGGFDMTSFKLARREAAELPGWNSIDVEVHGNDARFYLNGLLVNEVLNLVGDHEGPETPLRRGRIALQAESAEVEYRKVTLTRLR
jgi:Domain of Unknown Function (DUF1080)